jgi:hypothetical protein
MNTQTQEALKMAIEALEQAEEQLKKYWNEDINRGYYIENMDESPILLCEDTINVCKEALEQPAEQHKAFMDEVKYGQSFMLDGKYVPIENIYEQPAQEPMAWMNDEGFGLYPTNDTAIPLYTHPHQWQGLTDDEIEELGLDLSNPAGEFVGLSDWKIFARAIEQALKGKNHG